MSAANKPFRLPTDCDRDSGMFPERESSPRARAQKRKPKERRITRRGQLAAHRVGTQRVLDVNPGDGQEIDIVGKRLSVVEANFGQQPVENFTTASSHQLDQETGQTLGVE